MSLLTCAANQRLSDIHDRMPVIIERQNYATWLATDTPLAAVQALLKSAPYQSVVMRAVSTRGSSARNDGPDCIEALMQSA